MGSLPNPFSAPSLVVRPGAFSSEASTASRVENAHKRRHSSASQRKVYGLVSTLTLALILGSGFGAPLVFNAPPAFARGPDSLADLADAVSDAVVNISATQTVDEKHLSNSPQLEPGTPFDDLFEEFFKRRQQRGEGEGPNLHQHERKSNSLGSGFVIDSAGIVVTNNHVIADANDVTVIFTDGQKLKAEVIGKDAKVDVAVLKVKPEKPLKAV